MNEFKKLSPAKEAAAMSAVERIIDACRGKTSGLEKTASDILAKTPEMTPELCRRVCEAYNKSKSVYELSKRASDTRADSFPIINPDAVVANVYGRPLEEPKVDEDSIKKVAAFQRPEKLEEPLRKVAYTLSEQPVDLPDIRMFERHMLRAEKALETSVRRMRDKMLMHKVASEDAIMQVVSKCKRMPDKALHKFAHTVVNRFSDDGVALLSAVSKILSKDIPLQKTAAAAVLPLNEPYVSVAVAIEESRNYVQMQTLADKTADMLHKNAASVTDAAGTVVKGIDKLVPSRAAHHVREQVLDPLVDFAKPVLLERMTRDVGEDKEAKKIYDAEMFNRIKQLESTQAFVDVASDDFVKGYPIQDTMQAFNNVVSIMPEMLDPQYQPWLRAMVKQQLVQGNVYDEASMQKMMDMKSKMSRMNLDDIRTAEALELATDVGKKKVGMDETSARKILYPQHTQLEKPKEDKKDPKVSKSNKGSTSPKGEKKAPEAPKKKLEDVEPILQEGEEVLGESILP